MKPPLNLTLTYTALQAFVGLQTSYNPLADPTRAFVTIKEQYAAQYSLKLNVLARSG